MFDGIAVDVLPERPLLAHGHQLLIAAGHVAAAQVGLVDHATAPVAPAVVAPAVLGDDAVEVLAEGFQGGTVLDRSLHGLAEVGH
ncbi:hypothetical protein D9M68_930300 [compost metagenome]